MIHPKGVKTSSLVSEYRAVNTTIEQTALSINSVTLCTTSLLQGR